MAGDTDSKSKSKPESGYPGDPAGSLQTNSTPLIQSRFPPSEDTDDSGWEGPQAGTLISGTYRVVDRIGQGGMGLVILAEDISLQRQVAIKFVRPSLVTNLTMRHHFLAEARAMARVRHENVAEVYTFGEVEGAPYLVMEYIPGNTTIADWIKNALRDDIPPSIDEVIGFLDQLCRGVSAMHRSGVVHGDIKPNNVLIGPAFRVAIVDLGLSRIFAQNQNFPQDLLVGTPAYMAPEFVREGLDPNFMYRADVYSLGVMAFEMFTLESPYEVVSIRDIMLMYDSIKPPKPSDVRLDLPVAFDGVLQKALEVDPKNRTPTVDEFRKQLLTAREASLRSYQMVRILVADDDPAFRRLAYETLRFGLPDIEVECVADGSTALDFIDRQSVSVAVIDLDMPGVNGVELTAMIRGSEVTKNMPIIVVTAAGGAWDWTVLSSLGANGFLVKPVDPFALITLVRKTVGERGW